MNFKEEYAALKKSMPLVGFRGNDIENSDYGNYLYSCKNLYYSFDDTECNDSFYIFDCYKMESWADTNWSVMCENCYEICDSAKLYNCNYMLYCADCYDCSFCINCVSCHDCFGCINLQHKQYCIFNKQYTKEEYERKLKALLKEDQEINLKKAKDLSKKYPLANAHAGQNENSDYCNYLFRSNDSYYCFDCTDLNQCGYQFSTYESVNSWDGSHNFRCEQCYESNDSTDCYNSHFIDHCERCYDSVYLYNCNDCHDCFGCSNIANKSFCILNKQYSEEGYQTKITEIKKNLGWKKAAA